MSDMFSSAEESGTSLLRLLQESLDRNNAILTRLDNFLQQADARSALIKSAGDLDATLAHALDELRENSQKQLAGVREASVRYDAVLREVADSLAGSVHDRLENLQTAQTSLSQLEKLDVLDDIKVQLSEIRKTIQSGNSQLQWEIANLTDALSRQSKAEKRPAEAVSPQSVKRFMVAVVVCLLLELVAILFKF